MGEGGVGQMRANACKGGGGVLEIHTHAFWPLKGLYKDEKWSILSCFCRSNENSRGNQYYDILKSSDSNSPEKGKKYVI